MTDTCGDFADEQQARPLAVAKTPSSCRLCGLKLSSPQAFRAHLKTDEHVRNLQAKVAEPKSDSDLAALSSPTDGTNNSQKTKKNTQKPKYQPQVEYESEDILDSDSINSADDDTSISVPDFNPSECLFCPHKPSSSSHSNLSSTKSLEVNLLHMTSSHGFTIPFQDCLATDVTLETIVEYLHFVIHGYRECISCGTTRSTVEGVQQHMTAKGHCHFDLSPDTEEFYEMPQLASGNITDQDNDNTTRLLPSGKLISNRQSLDHTTAGAAQDDPRRLARRARAVELREKEPSSPIASLVAPKATPIPGFRTQRGAPAAQSTSTEVAVITRQGKNGEIIHQRSSEAILATQLSRLRIAGDKAQQREELRRRGRLESAGNQFLRHHFRISAGDSRAGKQFC